MTRIAPLVIGLVVVTLVSGGALATTALSVQPAPAQTNETASASNVTVQFENQTMTNSTVTIAAANLSDGGFVAVYNGNGTLLGVSEYLTPGRHENVTAALIRPLETPERDRTRDRDGAGERIRERNRTRVTTLLAIAHRDTNENRTFDYLTSGGTEDWPYIDDDMVLDDAFVMVDVPNDSRASGFGERGPRDGQRNQPPRIR